MKKLIILLSRTETKQIILLLQPALVLFCVASSHFVPTNQWIENTIIFFSLALNIVFLINLIKIKTCLQRVIFAFLFVIISVPLSLFLLSQIEGSRTCEIVSIISSDSVHYVCSTVSGEESNYIVTLGELTMKYFTPE